MSASERVNVFGFSAGELGWRRDGWESEARECEPNRHNIVNIYRGVSVSFHSRLSIRNTHRHTIRSYENKAMLCTRHSVCATQYRVCAVHGTADATPSAENAMYAHGVCVCLCMQERDTPQTTASTAASMVLECMHFFLSIRFEKEKPWHNGALFFRNTDARSFPVRFQLCAFSLFYFATFALVSFVIPRLWTVGTEIHRTDICIYRHTHIYECNEAQPRFAFTNDFSMNFSFYFCILFVVCFSPFFWLSFVCHWVIISKLPEI